MSVDLGGFDNPDDKNNSPMLGMRPFLEAASKLERSIGVIKDTQTRTNTQLDHLTKTLNRLIGVLGKSGSGARNGGGSAGSGHSYGQNGGGASFGGHPPGGGPTGGGGGGGSSGGGRPPNGGGGVFSGWRYNPQPSGTAPTGVLGTAQRIAAGMSGNTPKAWGTKYAALETGAAIVGHAGSAIANRGMNQMADQYMLELSFLRSQQRGATSGELDNGLGLMGIMGTRRNTADTMEQTNLIGRDAISGGLSTTDDVQANDLMERYAGALGTENGKLRWKSLKDSSAGLTYANPGMSLTQAAQTTTNLVKPSNRLKMVMLGLPDPTNSKGQYKGNAAFFAAFLKRMYQKDSVPQNVFDDDFAETGIGWANLVNVVGEEAADLMMEQFRAYNRAKSTGKDTGDFDQLFRDASLSGKEYDKSRKQLAEKYGVRDNPVMLKQRQNAISRASEMAGNSEYLEAEQASSEAMFTFAEAVHAFVNAPIIGDIANFLKGAGPGFMEVGKSATAGMVNINGMTGLSSQGPGDGGGGGPAPVPSAKKGDGDDATLNKIVSRARGYATGSRKYTYSMRKRNRDGYFDCSSFITRVYDQFGIDVGPTTVQMWKQGKPVDLDDVQPGDLVLWARGKPGAQSGAAEHVEMYIGNGKTVGTARAGPGQNTIQIQQYRKGDWDAARRIVGNVKQGKEKKDPSSPTTDDGGGQSLLDKLNDGVTKAKDALGINPGTGGGMTTAGSGSSIAGLGAGNAMAYSSSELDALTRILSGGGGGGSGVPGRVSGSSEESSSKEGTAKDVPYDAKGSTQEPGESAEDKKLGKNSIQKGIKEGKVRLDPNGRTKNYAPEKHPAPNASGNKNIARAMLKGMGWEQHWAALEKLWTRESSWNQYADNAVSDAYGIPQSLPGTKMSSAGADWRTNPATQIKWGLNYIKGRYGTPTKAWAHSEGKGWYADGVWQVPDNQDAVVHKDEMILPAQQAQTIRDALMTKNVGGGSSGERSRTPDSGSGSVTLHFSSGAIQLNVGQGASEREGRATARGFVKELEKHNLWTDIAKGGGKVTRARA